MESAAFSYMLLSPLFLQVFIGASERINKVFFNPSYNELISCGEAVFVWQFLAADSESLDDSQW